MEKIREKMKWGIKGVEGVNKNLGGEKKKK
jgi:hypothetical protein